MKKTAFSLILAVLISFIPAFAEEVIVNEGTVHNENTWTLNQNGVMKVRCTSERLHMGNLTSKLPFDPSDVKALVVEGECMSVCCFEGYENIEKITLPDTVSSISENSFCNTLYYKNHPDGMVYIGDILIDYKGKNVVKIGDDFFCSIPKRVEIKEGTRVIAESAFYGCSSLEEVVLPQSLKVIGWNAFKNCRMLKTINFPEGLERIDAKAFEGCGLRQIELPDSLQKIDGSAFDGCPLKRIESPAVMEKISSFSLCGDAEEIILREGTEYIENLALYSTCVKKLILPGSLTFIEDNAFSNLNELETVVFSEGIKRLETAAFEYCKIKSVVFPKSIEYIAKYLFAKPEYDDNYKIYYVPNIDEAAAIYGYEGTAAEDYAKKVERPFKTRADVFINGEEFDFGMIPPYLENGIMMISLTDLSKIFGITIEWKDEEQFIILYKGDKCVRIKNGNDTAYNDVEGEISAVSVAGGTVVPMRAIAEAFGFDVSWDNENKRVILNTGGNEDGLYVPLLSDDAVINKGADYCGNKWTLDRSGVMRFPASGRETELLNVYALTSELPFDPSDVKELAVEDGYTYIKPFDRYENIEKISLPDSVTSINANTFRDSLYYKNYPDNAVYIGNIFLGYKDKGILKIGDEYFYDTPKRIEIKEGTKIIAHSALEYCANLKEAILPQSVIIIGSSAFKDCKALKTIKLPESLTEINGSTFYGCPLNNINIHAAVKYIGALAYNAASAPEITLDSTGFVKRAAFSSCEAKKIVFTKEPANFDNAAFSYFKNLETVIFCEGIKRLEKCLFLKSSVSTVVFPKSIEYVENSIFGYEPTKFLNHFYRDIDENAVIYGYEGTAAEEYAKDVKRPFKIRADISVNGEEFYFDTVPPYLENGRTLVASGDLAKAAGLRTEWIEETNTLVMYGKTANIQITAGDKVMYVNGSPVDLDTPAVLNAGKLMIPLRAAAEGIGFEISWDNENERVILNTKTQ